MQEVKYRALKNYDEDSSVVECDNYPLRDTYYVQESKKYLVLKLVLILFIIIKLIYLINNFEGILNWLHVYNTTQLNYNDTDLLYENYTKGIYDDDDDDNVKTDYDEFYLFTKDTTETGFTNSNDSKGQTDGYKEEEQEIETISPYIIEKIKNTSDTADITTASNSTANYETTTKKLSKDGGTIENKIKTNDYDNTDLTTIKNSIDLNDDTDAITNNLKNISHNNHILTTIERTDNYLKNTIITSTSKLITDLPTTSISSSTTTTTTTTLAPLKTPAIKYSPLSSSSPSTSPKNVEKYFINTSRCHIPFVDPFTSDVRKIFKPKHSTGCTKDQPIVRVSFNDVTAQYSLHMNYTVAKGLRKSDGSNETHAIEEDLLCCYQEIIRSGSGSNVDRGFKLLPCANFHQNFVVPTHVNGVIVKCKSKSKNTMLQEDAFSFIQVNRTLMEQATGNETASERRKPSIFMIGIDTLSRMNFRRNMPQMFNYLVDNKWYELMGYNKVGDNTLPNLMPLLTGFTRNTVYNKCKPKTVVGGFDNCNFIWSKFKSHGYHTAYGEDTTSIATFNYNLKGFKKPPTDYYFRPMALAIEKSMKRTTKSGLNFCIGRRQFGEYIYDYGLEFATRYKNLTSFGFFWTNSFSHNSFDISATMDHTMVEYFKVLEQLGIFENSVVIFFSDHGVRWGPLLKLSQGFLEERLPMFFISLPKWFHRQYPELVKNLKINQQRLANSFDINMTLQHLLKLAEPKYSVEQTLDCLKCQSIFEEIPENRTCEDASIPETWCTCLPYKKVTTGSDTVKTIAKLIIEDMNNYYNSKNITYLCSPLQLKDITNAKVRYQDVGKTANNLTTYAIDFTTLPSVEPQPLFSATVDYDALNKRIHLDIEDISRQSRYEDTAKCTDDKQAKKYCICKNSLKSPKSKTKTIK